METTTSTQSYRVEHFFNQSWHELSYHQDRSTAETALAQWIDDEQNIKYSKGARIVHHTSKVTISQQVCKELEF